VHSFLDNQEVQIQILEAIIKPIAPLKGKKERARAAPSKIKALYHLHQLEKKNKYENMNPIEICSKIMKNRTKILDDFFEAYLASTLKDCDVKNLVLYEMPDESNNQAYKYWFAEDPELVWHDFDNKDYRSLEWIWVTDCERTWLSGPDTEKFVSDDFKWAKASIIHPPAPKKPDHKCTSLDGSYCEEKNGKLFLYHHGSLTSATAVNYCPFCGYELDGK